MQKKHRQLNKDKKVILFYKNTFQAPCFNQNA